MHKRSAFRILAGALLVLVLSSNGMAIPDQVIRWERIAGVIQPNNVVGSGTGAVTGGGQPWVVTDGRASVDLATGDVRFDMEGLVLDGGNSIGTRGTIAQVRATLVCDTNGSAGSGNSVLVNAPLVDLSAQGDANFSGNIGPLPGVCLTEPDIAFLIRNAGGAWLAAGVVRVP
jgi:hypothetical protein